MSNSQTHIAKITQSPIRLVIEVGIIVMMTELIIMLAIEFLFKPLTGEKFSDEFWDFADPVLLTVFLVPVLYFMVMRPMQFQQKLLERQNLELEKSSAEILKDEAEIVAVHQKELETRERMIQIEKLSSMGTMVGGVAHEINNPLMGILNYVEYAKEKATDKKAIEVLNDALHEIHRIRKIVRNMLVFIRTENSNQENCSVPDALKQTLSLLEGELHKNAVQIQINLPDDIPLVKCSAGSLQQVLLNLIINARDAIAGQDDQRITVTGHHVNEKVTLLVYDNGPGISPEVKDRIFDPFFTTKPAGKGTGLGLSVSRHLVEEVGGSISLQGEQSEGCCFEIVFNVAKQALI